MDLKDKAKEFLKRDSLTEGLESNITKVLYRYLKKENPSLKPSDIVITPKGQYKGLTDVPDYTSFVFDVEKSGLFIQIPYPRQDFVYDVNDDLDRYGFEMFDINGAVFVLVRTFEESRSLKEQNIFDVYEYVDDNWKNIQSYLSDEIEQIFDISPIIEYEPDDFIFTITNPMVRKDFMEIGFGNYDYKGGYDEDNSFVQIETDRLSFIEHFDTERGLWEALRTIFDSVENKATRIKMESVEEQENKNLKEARNRDNPSVYVASLSDYNDGKTIKENKMSYAKKYLKKVESLRESVLDDQKEDLKELAFKLKDEGFIVYLSDTTYGFYTDRKGQRVCYFQAERFGGFKFSGEYKPSRESGSGWVIDEYSTEGAMNLTRKDFMEMLYEEAPSWTGNRNPIYTTADEYLAKNDYSGYRKV